MITQTCTAYGFPLTYHIQSEKVKANPKIEIVFHSKRGVFLGLKKQLHKREYKHHENVQHSKNVRQGPIPLDSFHTER